MNAEFYKEINRIFDISEHSTVASDFELKQLDSLSRAEVILATEQYLGVELTNAEILALKTFGNLEDLLTSKTVHD